MLGSALLAFEVSCSLEAAPCAVPWTKPDVTVVAAETPPLTSEVIVDPKTDATKTVATAQERKPCAVSRKKVSSSWTDDQRVRSLPQRVQARGRPRIVPRDPRRIGLVGDLPSHILLHPGP